jgi:hypothetical protein
VALSSPAAARSCDARRASSAKQKQQRHHQLLTNGRTVLKTFPVNFDFYLTYLQYLLDLNFSEYLKRPTDSYL